MFLETFLIIVRGRQPRNRKPDAPECPVTAGSVMSVGFGPAATGEMKVAVGFCGARDVIEPVGREWLSGDGIARLSKRCSVPQFSALKNRRVDTNFPTPNSGHFSLNTTGDLAAASHFALES